MLLSILIPIYKTALLDPNIITNYRPISQNNSGTYFPI